MRILGFVAAAALLTACGGGEKAPAGQSQNGKAATPAAASAPAAAATKAATRNAYFGDTHVHTGNSFDAYAFGVRATPDDAYNFAKGKPIRHDGGYEIQLGGPPLDFLAVTDHAEYLGVVPAMNDPENPLSQTEIAQAAFGDNPMDAQATFLRIGVSFVQGQPIEEIYDIDYINSVWAETVDAAARHYEPGTFTTFSAYEFTSMVALSPMGDPNGYAANLHRNVIFAGDAPQQAFSTLNSPNPEDLWDWMDGQRTDGRDALSIPHNSNASSGLMFNDKTYEGEPLTADYAAQRMRNEPLIEISQIKGTSETHPSLSPNDEWADFEQYEYYIGSAVKAAFGKGDFARTALGRGLEMQDGQGFNPFKFGFVSASDTHIGAATLVEETHWGKFPTDGANPQGRSSVPPDGYDNWEDVPASDNRRVLTGSQYSASGIGGVWAEENTRESIFAAMRRKETFGTSGPRMKVRMFGGFGYDESVLEDADMLSKLYAGGVPIGGELTGQGEAPAFVAWAIQDPLSAPLQRLQIVKVWTENGEAKEALYDAVCSGGAAVDPATNRCPDNGASVDTSDCSTEAGTGAGELKTLWRDPDFDAGERAAYYVRVLENPTCRWSTWDAVRAGTPPNPELDLTVQERAWTSPIWHDPVR